ncbi:aspartyl protease family protein [Sphaerothrix gracilis]|uniref:aspartyl protease family protein n=1 Tax=Sphaerothrix gracilis TaxID=3151835 RepID=UPI0031FBD1E9
MTMGKLTIPKFEPNQVGQVTATILVTNHIDQILAERGFIADSAVRSIKLENVLVDTGATLLSLPADIIATLGLPLSGSTSVKTSAGSISSRIFREANLEINGRCSTFDCLELTEINIPLLGVLPMEALGIEPDLQNQRLRLLPMSGEDTYIYAM